MNENKFRIELSRDLMNTFPAGHFTSIPDQRIQSGGKRILSSPRPYDCFFLVRGVFMAMELKLHKTPSAFSFERISQHQRKSLLQVEKGGGIGYVLIHYRFRLAKDKAKRIRKKIEQEVKFPQFITWIVGLPISSFLRLEDRYLEKKGLQSIPFEDVVEWFGADRIVADMEERLFPPLYPSFILQRTKGSWSFERVIDRIVDASKGPRVGYEHDGYID